MTGHQPVDHLPSSLKLLSFGYNFDQRVDYLPLSITHLYFRMWFAQLLDHLPTSTTHISLYYRSLLLDHLPASVTHLTITGPGIQALDHLPSSIKQLPFQSPFSAKCQIGNRIREDGVHAFTILNDYKSTGTGIIEASLDHFPPSITCLALGSYFDRLIDYLPPLSLIIYW
jgi:hypothetical protein